MTRNNVHQTKLPLICIWIFALSWYARLFLRNFFLLLLIEKLLKKNPITTDFICDHFYLSVIQKQPHIFQLHLHKIVFIYQQK